MKVLSFGEILFDVFDGSEKLGGAPLNFCADMVRLGAEGYMLSAFSRDRLGNNAAEAMKKIGIDYSLSCDESLFGTGVCSVTRDENGEPTYDLVEGVAYDHIALTEERLNRIRNEKFDLFYFGTLAQRNMTSFSALSKLFENCSFPQVFFDLNIRGMYYSGDVIEKGLQRATILKLNYSECRLLCDMGFCMTAMSGRCDDAFLKTVMTEISDKYDIGTVIITLDKDGAAVYRNGEYYRSAPCTSPVVSAVGAGDAFSACFAYNLLCGKSLAECTDRANILGDYTVRFLEALPPYDDELLAKVRD